MSAPLPGRTATLNAVRPLFLAGGFVCLGSGFVGMFVPGWPTTVFWIMALYCFKRSSPRFEAYLLNHAVFGPTLRDWDENKWISRRVKVIACASITLFSGFAVWIVRKPETKWIIAGVAMVGTAYVLTRRTKPE